MNYLCGSLSFALLGNQCRNYVHTWKWSLQFDIKHDVSTWNVALSITGKLSLIGLDILSVWSFPKLPQSITSIGASRALRKRKRTGVFKSEDLKLRFSLNKGSILECAHAAFLLYSGNRKCHISMIWYHGKNDKCESHTTCRISCKQRLIALGYNGECTPSENPECILSRDLLVD